MKFLKKHILFVGIVTWIAIHQSCTHDPSFIMEPDPNPMDTMIIDTMEIAMPCDSNIVYFQNHILPIFIGNCAFSGCHDVTTASDGVLLDNYDNIINTGEIKPFDLDDSKAYEVLTENDPDEVMPPSGKLDGAQINLIATWILQGAKNLECDEDSTSCDLQDISYSGFVAGIIQTFCNGCHATGVASGGIVTDNYTDVKSIVDAGRLYGALNWSQGYSSMPQGQSKLNDCTIDKIKSWIDAGAQDN